MTDINEHKLHVKCQGEDLNLTHPLCPHGPTLLFYRYTDDGVMDGYFACAAHRNKRLCNFHQDLKLLDKSSLNKEYHNGLLSEIREKRLKLFEANSECPQHYCHKCDELFLDSDFGYHFSHNNITWNLTIEKLKDPTQFLTALQDDKVEAQYFFDEKALKFFVENFRKLNINKVLCLGAPRLHCYLLNHCPDISSFLLDIDHRYYYFFPDAQFAWYNMCNNYFFDEIPVKYFNNFLTSVESEKLLIFTDPPFGCRTEPIANTLVEITKDFCKLNNIAYCLLPIFWIFPYFSEGYIKRVMPQLEMSDYKINYTNHLSYTDKGCKSRKYGSPVRLFTNIPLAELQLPIDELYKYCKRCQRYTALENRHCAKCDGCMSKNGQTYQHCNHCAICTKPNYVHCFSCRRCTQANAHNCKDYESKQHCMICLKVGHVENHCLEWITKHGTVVKDRNDKLTCLICGKCGHNESQCKRRGEYIEEETFMGERVVVRFKD